MPVAYSYVRFSTTEQRKGHSLQRQIDLSNEYAEKHGLTIDTTLKLHDLGVSAYDRSNIDRGKLGGFLDAIKRGRIAPGSYLLVESLDRLSRDKVLDALAIFILILQQGITIVTLGDKMVYDKTSVGDNSGNLMYSIMSMSRAHEESATKSRRLLAGWEHKRKIIDKKKLTAQCPRWMRLNKDKTEFELIKERVDVVKEILALVKIGMGQAQIAKLLNARSEPCISGNDKGWYSSYVCKIIKSTALYGEFQPCLWNGGKLTPHGDPIENYYPALISKEEFYLLQNLRKQRMFSGAKARKGTTVPNLLSGITKCGYCGSTMVLVGSSAKRVYSEDGVELKRPSKKVLTCDGARRGLGCYAIQWGYNDIEKSFLTFCRTLHLEELLNNAEAIEHEKNRQLTIRERLQSIKSEIADYQKKIANLISYIEDGNPSMTVSKRIQQLETKLTKVIDEQDELEKAVRVTETATLNRAIEIESVRELIKYMESNDSDKVFKIRAALSEHIRHVIEVVQVYPAGSLKSPEEIQRIRANLIKAHGYSSEQADKLVAERYRTEPARTGRGIRGRYASRKDIERYFTIKGKDGGIRFVYPDFDEPSKMKILIDVAEGDPQIFKVP